MQVNFRCTASSRISAAGTSRPIWKRFSISRAWPSRGGPTSTSITAFGIFRRGEFARGSKAAIRRSSPSSNAPSAGKSTTAWTFFQRKNKRVVNRLSMHYDTFFKWPHLDDPIRGDRGFCHALSRQLGILADGTVVPCCLDKEAAVNLGSCQNRTLDEVLAGKRATKRAGGLSPQRARRGPLPTVHFHHPVLTERSKSAEINTGLSGSNISEPRKHRAPYRLFIQIPLEFFSSGPTLGG